MRTNDTAENRAALALMAQAARESLTAIVAANPNLYTVETIKTNSSQGLRYVHVYAIDNEEAGRNPELYRVTHWLAHLTGQKLHDDGFKFTGGNYGTADEVRQMIEYATGIEPNVQKLQAIVSR